MYDKFLIVEELLKNVEKDGQIIGYQYGARLPYYRGVVLSLVGEMDLTVDNEAVSPDQMTVTLHGNTYKLADLENIITDKWEFGEVGIITVLKPGGLKPGEHKFKVRQHMLISYVRGGFWGGDQKTLSLAG